MERTIEASESQMTIEEVIRDVVAKGDQIIVEQDGEPVAAVVPVELYRQWRHSRRAAGDMLRAMAERANMDPDEADELAAEAVRWARNNKEV
jgi:prevent-host-death family protein